VCAQSCNFLDFIYTNSTCYFLTASRSSNHLCPMYQLIYPHEARNYPLRLIHFLRFYFLVTSQKLNINFEKGLAHKIQALRREIAKTEIENKRELTCAKHVCFCLLLSRTIWLPTRLVRRLSASCHLCLKDFSIKKSICAVGKELSHFAMRITLTTWGCLAWVLTDP
jgi:hypothetical protein